MTDRKEIIEIGWNLDHSYARLPKSFFTSKRPTPVHSQESEPIGVVRNNLDRLFIL
jgi:hypothetical protein